LRRITSLLSGLSLLALGLGLTLTPAAANEDHGCGGDIVVQLDARVWGRPGHDSYTLELAQPIGPGEWAINTMSFDGYEGREKASQDHEQWNLQFIDAGVVVATVGPTSDIPDGADYGESIDNLGVVELEFGADALRVVHLGESTKFGTDSVHAACVGLEHVPPPATTTIVPTSTSTTTTTTTTPSTTAASTSTTTVPTTTMSTSTVPTSTAPTSTVPTSTAPTSTVPTSTAPTSTSTSLPGGNTQGPVGDNGGIAPGAITTLGSIPRLRASLDCSARAIVAEITNIGDASAVVDVFLVSNSVRTGIGVAPGSGAEIDFALPSSAENTTFDLVVSDQSGIADTGSVHVDCEAPPSVTAATGIDCVSGSLLVDLSNDGQEADSVSVIVEQSGLVDTVAIAGGQSERVAIDIGARSSIPLRVVAGDGSDVFRRSVPVDCPSPFLAVSTSVSCTTSEILVTVWNHGDAQGLVGARLDGAGVDGVAVESGRSAVIGLPFEPGSRLQTLSLTGSESLEAAGGEILIGCERGLRGAPQPTSPCSSVSIAGSSVSTTTIIPAPNRGHPWWVDAGWIAGLSTSEGVNASRSCATPEVEFSPNCSIGTLTIRMSNVGSIATRLAVLIDGEASGGGIDLGPGADTITAAGISGARTVEVFEAGRAEPLATLHLSCGSGDHGLRTAAYAVFSMSILASLLSAVVDPRRMLAIFR